jgi:hypothetical protein
MRKRPGPTLGDLTDGVLKSSLHECAPPLRNPGYHATYLPGDCEGQAERCSALHAPIPPAPQKFHQAQVPQRLQLLADFVAHVPVRGMQFSQVPGEGVDVLKSELVLVERADDVENVEGPAARVSPLLLVGARRVCYSQCHWRFRI